LPTYPFQHHHYWLNTTTPTPNTASIRFLESLESEDVDAVASALAIDRGSSLETVLPALSTWRKRHEDQAVIDSWGYRETWKPVTLPQSSTRSPGTWLIVAPTLQSRTAPIDVIVDALHRHGARTITLTLDSSCADPETLAQRLAEHSDLVSIDGVLSLLAFDEEPHPEHPHLPTGTALTLTLIQTLTTHPNTTAPLWCLTQTATTTHPTDPLNHPTQAHIWGLG
ncbi:polyketide synthase, partial [Streptomyces sp. MCAF7]